MTTARRADGPVVLPEVLDLLIVGGGPGGTAAACRGVELGLSVLVIDYDDLMKRIRDYSKDKLILPGFGGGDQMCFPKGGPLLEELCFGPIDKDDLCAAFRECYATGSIPYLTSVELLGLTYAEETLEAKTWNHRDQREQVFRARHVALAIGRGVPRRFDIPGNTEGIAFRLEDPRLYLGRPACVVGGGTSAAEAVIALSNAKAAAGDGTEVHWSYRGDKMPRVAKALAEVFFEAYVGNGNIRYHPRSEPTAVVVGEDRREFLAIRTDRRNIEGRPNETTHLEFPKDACIACIGEDLPTALLEDLGIAPMAGGPRGKKRMVVNRFLESSRRNLFLVGDILSQAYLEADDLEADPGRFREVKHRGNIKSAMRDGVLVAQVVRQRLDGCADVAVAVEDADEPEVKEQLSPGTLPRIVSSHGGDKPKAILISLLPGGVQGEEFALASGGTTFLGRKGCDLSFPEDEQLADRHASLQASADGYLLQDEGGQSGVFLRLRPAAKTALEPGDLIRSGRQFILVAEESGRPVLVHYGPSGAELGRHPLDAGTVVLGRDAPDLTLDPDDRTLSRRHLALSYSADGLFVKDLKSANGTEVRVRGAVLLADGACFRIGKQTLALSTSDRPIPDYRGPTASVAKAQVSEVSAAGGRAPASAVVSSPGRLAPTASAGAPTGPSVTLTSGESFAVQPGQTLCEAAEAAGITLNAECHSGICGSDPIRILEGIENLDGGPSSQESETLEDICELDPGECRLACMVRLKGPVTVEIL